MDKLEMIKPGFVFKNGVMELTVIQFAENEKSNVLLVKSDEGMFITARNLSRWKNGYTWDWGHYYSDLNEAIKDYYKRLKDL